MFNSTVDGKIIVYFFFFCNKATKQYTIAQECYSFKCIRRNLLGAFSVRKSVLREKNTRAPAEQSRFVHFFIKVTRTFACRIEARFSNNGKRINFTRVCLISNVLRRRGNV